MDLLPLVQEVQTAAEVLSSGDKVTHARLLHSIHKLTLAVETPTETLMRICFQVCCSNTPGHEELVEMFEQELNFSRIFSLFRMHQYESRSKWDSQSLSLQERAQR